MEQNGNEGEVTSTANLLNTFGNFQDGINSTTKKSFDEMFENALKILKASGIAEKWLFTLAQLISEHNDFLSISKNLKLLIDHCKEYIEKRHVHAVIEIVEAHPTSQDTQFLLMSAIK